MPIGGKVLLVSLLAACRAGETYALRVRGQVKRSACAMLCASTASSANEPREDGVEAVLQGTDWGSWGSWMASSQTVGVAPGYKVSNLRSRCSAGGFLGRECVVGAKLCK